MTEMAARSVGMRDILTEASKMLKGSHSQPALIRDKQNQMNEQ